MLDKEILVFLPGVLDTLINSVAFSGVPDRVEGRERPESQPPRRTEGCEQCACRNISQGFRLLGDNIYLCA